MSLHRVAVARLLVRLGDHPIGSPRGTVPISRVVEQTGLRGVHELGDVGQTQTRRPPLGIGLGPARAVQVTQRQQTDSIVVLDHRAVVGLERARDRGGSLELGDRPHVLLLQPRQRERLMTPRPQVVQSQFGCNHPRIPGRLDRVVQPPLQHVHARQ